VYAWSLAHLRKYYIKHSAKAQDDFRNLDVFVVDEILERVQGARLELTILAHSRELSKQEGKKKNYCDLLYEMWLTGLKTTSPLDKNLLKALKKIVLRGLLKSF